MNKSLLQSFIDELTGLIRHNEGQFAEGVLSDFREALEITDNQLALCRRWLKIYYGGVTW